MQGTNRSEEGGRRACGATPDLSDDYGEEEQKGENSKWDAGAKCHSGVQRRVNVFDVGGVLYTRSQRKAPLGIKVSTRCADDVLITPTGPNAK